MLGAGALLGRRERTVHRGALSLLALLLPLTGCGDLNARASEWADKARAFADEAGIAGRLGLEPPEPPPVAAPPPPRAVGVAALGRLEPRDGVIRVAGPSGSDVVIDDLRVEEGDHVEKGAIIATLDTVAIFEAQVAGLRAEYEQARRDRERNLQLYEDRVLSDAQRDAWETQVKVARHALRRAEAELERARVRAPISGQVLLIHAREGERVGPEGILELGRTEEMFAVAEVYEEDVGRVHLGQPARVKSPALPGELDGTVEKIALEVRKQDALGTDPAARKDGRIVEVEIRLADAEPAAALTNLQVEILIGP
jgi:HlyD family secretion protein